MIIENKHDIKTNLKNSVEFGVSENSAKIFSFLSNFLYTNKERSVLTELTSNALDAHVESGNPQDPIQVTFPTQLCPELRIRDFGFGLAEENVYRYLTKYGESSKTGTNEQIGGFGIGSKSPAAVTDTWTINSHHGGLHTQYLIHVNENGIPAINKLFSKATTETGLEVVLPIKPSQISRWHDEAYNTFKFYSPMPICKSIKNQPIPVDILFNGINFFSNVKSDHKLTSVVINRREYVVQWEKIEGPNKEYYDYIKSLKINLKFDIGELSVSLSREDLQYDKKTIDAIDAKCKTVVDELTKYWEKEVSPASNIFDYKLRMIDFCKKYTSNNRNIFKILADNAKDKFTDIDYENEFFKFSVSADEYIHYVNSNGCKKVRNRFGYSISNAHIKSEWSSKTYLYFLLFKVSNRDDLVIVLRDATTAPSRVKLYLTHPINQKKEVLIVDKALFDSIPNDFNKIIASSLDKPIIFRKKKDKLKSEIYHIQGKHFSPIDENDLDKTKDIVCFKFKKANTVRSLDKESKELYEFYSRINTHAIIVAVYERNSIPSYAMSPKEYLEKTYNFLLTKKNDIEKAKIKDILDKNYRYGLIGYINETDKSKLTLTIKQDSVYYGIVNIIKSVSDIADGKYLMAQWDLLKTCEVLLNKPLSTLSTLNIADFSSKLHDTYPMLKFVEQYLSGDDYKKILTYINLCER